MLAGVRCWGWVLLDSFPRESYACLQCINSESVQRVVRTRSGWIFSNWMFFPFENASWSKWECSAGMCQFWQIAAARGFNFAMGTLATKSFHAPGPHISTAALAGLGLPKGPLPVSLWAALLGVLGSLRQTRQAPLLPHSRAFLSFFKPHVFSQSGILFSALPEVTIL